MLDARRLRGKLKDRQSQWGSSSQRGREKQCPIGSSSIRQGSRRTLHSLPPGSKFQRSSHGMQWIPRVRIHSPDLRCSQKHLHMGTQIR